jgi:hypothetical protein
VHPFLRLRNSGRWLLFEAQVDFWQAELGEEGALVLVGEGLGAGYASEDVEDLGVAGGGDLAEEEEFVHFLLFLSVFGGWSFGWWVVYVWFDR